MKNITAGLIVFCVLSLTLADVNADDFQIRPYIAVRGEYDDNIYFDADSDNAEEDFILTIKPGIVLTNRTERLNARLSGQVAPFFYKDNSDLDDVDQDYRGRISYRFTPRFSADADAFFIEDHRIDRDLLNTGLVQNADRRRRYHFGGGLGYNITEITTANINYDFNRDNWEKQAGREDVDYNSVDIGLRHDLSRWLPETTGQLTFGYGNVDRDSAQSDTFSSEIGIRYRLSELFNLRLRGGGRYVSSDFDTQTGTDRANNREWGYIGMAILGYNGEKTRSNLLFSRDLSPGSGRNTPTVLTRLIGSVRYRVLEDLRIGLRAGVYHNKADSGDFGTQEVDQYTYRLRPDIRWDFYENFALTAAYRYTYIDNQVADRNSTRNSVFMEVSYGLPLSDLFDLTGSELRQVVSGAIPAAEPR